MAAQTKNQDTTLRVAGPFRGINLSMHPGHLEWTEAWDCLNISLYSGTIKKRDGWRPKAFMANESLILGIYNYLKSTATGISIIHLVKAGSVLYKVVDWDDTELQTGLSASNLASMITMNNRVYYADGANFKVTDGTSVFNAQIAQPSAAPSVATGSSGVLYGDYDYKVTFYSTTWGQESPASAASTVVSVKNQQAALTSIPLAPGGGDARVTGRRIYRRKVSASESLWHLVHYIADITTATWNDNVRDVDAEPLTISPLSYSSTLPNFRFLAYQSGVLFASGATGEGELTRLYYSRPDQPYSMTQYLEIGSGHDTDPVTGLSAFQGVLVVFKANSIWILTGNSSDTFSLTKVVPGIGCRSHHSIVDGGEALYFLGEDGFYLFDGAIARKISGATTADPIGPLARTRNRARDEFCVGVFDPHHQAIMWSFSPQDYDVNNLILVYWLENSKRVQFPSWTPWSLHLGTQQYITAWGSVTDPDTEERYPVFGLPNGTLGHWGFDGDGDDTTEIECFWTTGKYDLGCPELWKTWGEFTLDMTAQNDPSTFTITYGLDGGQGNLASHTTSDPVCRRRFARYSRELYLIFYSNNSKPMELLSWTIEAGLAGAA